MCPSYVLVVEDDDDARDMVVRFLQRTCPDVRCASNGVDALALIEHAGLPEVVLTDIVMPGVLGTSVAGYVELIGLEHVPLAFVTGSPELAPAGATVFRKPARMGALRDFVAAHMSPHVT